jgi:hypothetical protein
MKTPTIDPALGSALKKLKLGYIASALPERIVLAAESRRQGPRSFAGHGRRDHRTTLSPPPAGPSRWTTRLLAKRFGLTSGAISDLLRKHSLKLHLGRSYKVSRDCEFVAKVRDVVGLYLNPPTNAMC